MPLLKERPTVVKVVAVLLSVAGVALVSFYSSNSKCSPLTNSTSPANSSSSSSSQPFVLHHPHAGANPCLEQSTWYGYVVSVPPHPHTLTTYALTPPSLHTLTVPGATSPQCQQVRPTWYAVPCLEAHRP